MYGFSLGGRLRVRAIEKVLDTYEHGLDGDGGSPALVLVENTEADGARGIYIGVEQRRHKLTLWWLHFNGFRLKTKEERRKEK